MNAKKIIGAGLVLPLVATIGFMLGSPAYADHDDGPKIEKVNCDDGKSINKKIAKAPLDQKLIIEVKGTCVENVVIDRDWVTLQPEKSGGSIAAADPTKPVILITGRHVTVQDFDDASISGGNIGVDVTHGGAASILNNHITDNHAAGCFGIGVRLTGASSLILEGNLIDHNDFGLVVNDASNATVTDNDVIDNDGPGATMGRGASINLRGGNSFSSNGNGIPCVSSNFTWGFIVNRIASARILGANTFTNNAGAGILCGHHSFIAVDQVQTFGGNGGGPVFIFGNCETSGTFF